MPFFWLCVVTCIYFWVGACFAFSGQWASATIYVGYAVANFGLIALLGRPT